MKNNMSQEDLANKLGYKALSTIAKWESGVAEPSVRVVKKVAEIFSVDFRELATGNLTDDPDLSGLTNISYPAARGIPILGIICSGNGIFCEENYDGEFFIDRSVKADLCLRIKGDSMKDAGISDGDYVFIRKAYDFEGGKIYAVRINGDDEAVIKVLHKKGNSVILSSRNVEYEPLIEPAENVSVIGEFVGVYHTI